MYTGAWLLDMHLDLVVLDVQLALVLFDVLVGLVIVNVERKAKGSYLMRKGLVGLYVCWLGSI